jgi:N-acetylglucosamine-6-phosphate deacetylase
VSRIVAGRIARGGEIREGWVHVDGERITAGGEGPSPRPPDELLDGIIGPGLCDLQVNGAGGHDVIAGGPALEAIDPLELARGVTSYLPTLVSPDDRTAETVLAEIGRRAADPASPVAGAHVEGPFLNPAYAGMHPVERLRVPADGVPAWLASPAIRMVTLAPELPGALELVDRLAARGVAVSLGHSGADAETAEAAIDAGARLVTHVFNAMAPFHHRAPSLPGVGLIDERVRVGVIADGVHLDSLALELVRRAAGERVVLVSDSTPAAAAPTGRYDMAGVSIDATPGAARTAAGVLAGSAITLDAAVRSWVELTGATLAEAIAAASEAPAAAVGLPAPLAPGSPADLCVLDETGTVVKVMRRGRWLAQ